MGKKISLSELSDKNIIKVAKGKNLPKDYKDKGDYPVIAAGKTIAYLSSHTNYETNTITISSSGANAGFVWKHTYPIWASDCTVIQTNKNIDFNYLYLFLLSKQQLIYSFQSGAGQPHVYWKDIKNIEINFPDLDQQKQIARALDKAQALIDLRKESIAKLDELAKSIFIDIFGDPISNPKGWQKSDLSETYINKGDFVDGPFGSDLKVSDRKNEGVRIIQINNIGINEFRNSNKAYISEKKYLTLKRHEALYGDIIIAKMGEPIARSCFLPNYLEKAIIVADCMRLRVTSPEFNSKFICFYLNLDSTKCLINNLTHGSTRVRINLSILKTLSIINPPLKLQNKFASIIEKIEEQKSLYEQELEKLEENFQALLQQSFQE